MSLSRITIDGRPGDDRPRIRPGRRAPPRRVPIARHGLRPPPPYEQPAYTSVAAPEQERPGGAVGEDVRDSRAGEPDEVGVSPGLRWRRERLSARLQVLNDVG